MKSIWVTIFVGLVFSGLYAKAQDTLPSFTIANRGGQIVLNWVNTFPVVKQLSIQRSTDSLKGFKTILTLPDPSSVRNGFIDRNAPSSNLYYKLYILLDGGNYLFSTSKRPEKIVSVVKPEPRDAEVKKVSPVAVIPNNEPAKPQTETAKKEEPVKVVDTKPVVTLSEPVAKQEPTTTPSASLRTYETAKIAFRVKRRSDNYTINKISKLEKRGPVKTPACYVYNNFDGNVTFVLPLSKFRDITVKFFDAAGDEVFSLDAIKEGIVIIDRTNFLRSGRFRYELYEKGVLKEKSAIQIPRAGVPR